MEKAGAVEIIDKTSAVAELCDTPRLSGPRPCRSKTADAPMSWSLFCMSRPMGKSSGFVSLSDIST
jgi:hypothetical protein